MMGSNAENQKTVKLQMFECKRSLWLAAEVFQTTKISIIITLPDSATAVFYQFEI